MAHLTAKSAYSRLVDRINKFPQGAPPSKLLYKILEMLFSEQDAKLISLVPLKPFTAKQMSSIWKMTEIEAGKYLDDFASRGLLLDIDYKGELKYVLPPPMAGFFEFTLMRVRDDIDQKLLSELFYQYLTVEADFMKELFSGGATSGYRTFVNEEATSLNNSLVVMDYEKASNTIKKAKSISVGMCYCRHKMQHLNKACDAPMDICMTFDEIAQSLIKHRIARKVDAVEGLDLLQQARDNDLVQFGENTKKGVGFMCHCCGCCCEALIAQRRFSVLHPINTTNYIPEIDENTCIGCGKCVAACPVQAINITAAIDPDDRKKKKAVLDKDLCLGCGICVRKCSLKSMKLVERENKVITPVTSVHKTVLMAIERGKLQNLIFDNQALFSHRAMAAILCAILKLPPIKQALASKQFQSKYLKYLISQ